MKCEQLSEINCINVFYFRMTCLGTTRLWFQHSLEKKTVARRNSVPLTCAFTHIYLVLILILAYSSTLYGHFLSFSPIDMLIYGFHQTLRYARICQAQMIVISRWYRSSRSNSKDSQTIHFGDSFLFILIHHEMTDSYDSCFVFKQMSNPYPITSNICCMLYMDSVALRSAC